MTKKNISKVTLEESLSSQSTLFQLQKCLSRLTDRRYIVHQGNLSALLINQMLDNSEKLLYNISIKRKRERLCNFLWFVFWVLFFLDCLHFSNILSWPLVLSLLKGLPPSSFFLFPSFFLPPLSPRITSFLKKGFVVFFFCNKTVYFKTELERKRSVSFQSTK